MRRLCAVIVFILISAGAQAYAQAPCGGRTVTATVQVLTSDGGVSYDHTKSAQELTAMGGESLGGSLTRGLRDLRLSSDIKVRTRGTQSPSGGLCLEPVEIIATISMSTTVYIDSDYGEGTCQYTAVMNHEMTHVAIDRNTYNRWYQTISDALAAAAASRAFPHWARDDSQGRDDVIGYFNSTLVNTLDLMGRERDTKNGQIDSPESYAAVQAQCPNW
jgi:hypothetical protein